MAKSKDRPPPRPRQPVSSDWAIRHKHEKDQAPPPSAAEQADLDAAFAWRLPRWENREILPAMLFGAALGFVLSAGWGFIVAGTICGAVATLALNSARVETPRLNLAGVASCMALIWLTGVFAGASVPVEFDNVVWKQRIPEVRCLGLWSRSRFGGPVRFFTSDAMYVKVRALKDIREVSVQARDGNITVGWATVTRPLALEGPDWETTAALPLTLPRTVAKIVVTHAE